MIDFSEIYSNNCNKISDIFKHLPTLYNYSKDCRHITEFGVRDGLSTSAFLYANPLRLVSYDLGLSPVVCKWFDYAKSINKNYDYIESDVLNITIENTDFLFIDTLHTYNQLSQELTLHGNKVSKFIAFHDTLTYGNKGEIFGERGLKPAINEFLKQNPNWQIDYEVAFNHGLTIIKNHQS